MAQEEVKNGETEMAAPLSAPITGLNFQLLIEAPKADDAIKFYKEVYGAAELKRFTYPKRKAGQERMYISRADLKIGSSIIIVSDNVDDAGEPLKVEGGTPSSAMWLETNDVDATVAKAVEAGALAEKGIKAGCLLAREGRFAAVKDPFGILWYIFSFATEEAGAETEKEPPTAA